MGPFERDRGGWIGGLIGGEEIGSPEATITLAALRIEDLERRPAARRAVAIASNQCLGLLADDVPPEPDPRASGKLQAEPGGSGHGTRQVAAEAGRLEHHEERLRAPGQGRQAVESIGQAGRAVCGGDTAAGQVQDQQIHRPPGEQRATDGQPLIEGLRGDDHQPLEPDAASERFNRIEGSRQVDPGHDGTGRLGLGGQPEDERGPAARAVTTQRDARRARQAAGFQDGVEGGEARSDDPLVRLRPGLGPGCWFGPGHRGHRRQRQGSIGDPRSCRSPASLEVRHGCRHVRGECRHPSKIEHLFYRINYRVAR
jgi:hypothetical protein